MRTIEYQHCSITDFCEQFRENKNSAVLTGHFFVYIINLIRLRTGYTHATNLP